MILVGLLLAAGVAGCGGGSRTVTVTELVAPPHPAGKEHPLPEGSGLPTPPDERVHPNWQAIRATPRCAPADLVVWRSGANFSGGIMSTIHTSFSVTNVGTHACRVAGFPRLFSLDVDGRAVGGTDRPGGEPLEGRGPVRIGVGDEARFLASWPEDVFPAGKCKEGGVAGFRIELPGSNRSWRVPYPSPGHCTGPGFSGSSVGRLEAVPPPRSRGPLAAPHVVAPRPGESLPRCPPAKVVASLDPYMAGGVAAGRDYLRIALTNFSGKTCRLSGIPTVVAIDTAGRSVGAPATKSPWIVGLAGNGRHLAAARLEPHGVAYFTVATADPGGYGPGECGYVLAAGFRITLPGAARPQVLPMPNRRCPHEMRGGGQLSVGRIE